jgi:hypothetical protein
MGDEFPRGSFAVESLQGAGRERALEAPAENGTWDQKLPHYQKLSH